jgi:hypothetical protein
MRAATVHILVSLAFLMAAFVFAVVMRSAAAPAELEVYAPDEPLDAMLLPLDKKALDTAYQEQLIHLWKIYLTQGAQDIAPPLAGLRNARRAYHHAAEQIAKREQQLRDK